MKIKKSIEEVTNDLRELFTTGYPGAIPTGLESGGMFLIPKSYMERPKVINTLSIYFSTVEIIGGTLEISPITLVFTRFKIVPTNERDRT